jgi:putative oxidoreductase
MLPHGIAKITGGIAPVQEMLTAKGLPIFLSYGVYIGEFIAPIFILVGYFGRPAALIFAITMAFSIYLAYGLSGFGLNQYGGILVELNLLFLFGALALFFTGSGKYSIRRGANPWD